jgi:uncharacterized protein with NRDE domain
MCFVAVLFRAVGDAPVVVAANREEAYARGGTPPQLLDDPPALVAGFDPRAGGTWLGVNRHGVLVAVTNRPRAHPPPGPRSRGLLVRDLLAAPSAAAAVARAERELSADRYAGCNVLCLDADHAAVAHAGERVEVCGLPPGVHVLTTRDVNDPTDPRVAFARGWLKPGYPSADAALADLRRLCARTDDPAICLHGAEGGTVSSCLVVLRRPPGEGGFWSAAGPPDRAAYEDRSGLLQGLLT